MKSQALLLPIIFAIIATATHELQACSCPPKPSSANAVAQADAVFSGKIEKVELVVSTVSSFRRIKITVARVWKGDREAAAEIFTGPDQGACGYDFQVNATYLIYAYKSESGRLQTDICTRTAAISRAQEDLNYLGPAVNEKGACCGSPDIFSGDAVLFLGMIFFLLMMKLCSSIKPARRFITPHSNKKFWP